MDRGVCQATVLPGSQSRTQLNMHTCTVLTIYCTIFTPKHILRWAVEFHYHLPCQQQWTQIFTPPSWNPSFLWLLEKHFPSTHRSSLSAQPQVWTWAQFLDRLLSLWLYTPDVFFWSCGFKHHFTSKTPKLMSPPWTCPNSKLIYPPEYPTVSLDL